MEAGWEIRAVSYTHLGVELASGAIGLRVSVKRDSDERTASRCIPVYTDAGDEVLSAAGNGINGDAVHVLSLIHI